MTEHAIAQSSFTLKKQTALMATLTTFSFIPLCVASEIPDIMPTGFLKAAASNHTATTAFDNSCGVTGSSSVEKIAKESIAGETNNKTSVSLGQHASQTETLAEAAGTKVDSEHYKGKWVAMNGSKVVNSASSLKELRELMKEDFNQKILVRRVSL